MDVLSQRLAALADPTRRAIVARLANGEASVAELRQPFSISQPAISKHLKVLENAGLIETRQAGQSRPRRLKVEAFRETVDWLQHVQTVWHHGFERLATLLDEQSKQEKDNQP